MKNKIKSALIPLMLLVLAFALCACGEKSTQFDRNDEAGYTVSVKFDANGGEFTTSCSVIVDAFNISGMATNSNGMVELALIAPDNTIRGANDTYNVARNGYFLAGWYTSCTEATDSEGNAVCTYSGKWDFQSSRVEVDPNQTYSSAEPVITLYAAWVPMYEINFYNLGSNELLKTYSFNPTSVSSVMTPQWNEETGAVEMYKFPKRTGYTFNGAFYDAEGTQAVGETVDYPTFEQADTITDAKTCVNVYVDWMEGEWYRIYTAEQFVKNVNRAGCFEICADLDFTGLEWPAAYLTGEFKGTIIGNGHTISNVSIVQTDNSKTHFGLFGNLSAGAVLQDIVFRNITATIQAGIRTSGADYGLFAGKISSDATISGVQVLESTLQIDSSCVLSSNDYAFGLVCGAGNSNVLDVADITAIAVGENPESVTITVLEDGILQIVIE